jgi:uncharacterized phiE125 gp8 family phage protein
MSAYVQKPTVGSSPILLAEAKEHLRIESAITEDDTLIQSYLDAATAYVEGYTRRAISSQTFKLVLDRFPYEDPRIFLPGGKVQSVTSIVYADSDSTTVTLTGPTSSPAGTDYQESLLSQNAPFLLPSYNETWPTVAEVIDPVVITYVAGYGDPSASPYPDYPPQLLHAIRVMLADFYERRSTADMENSAAWACKAIAAPYSLPLWLPQYE